MRTDQEIDQDYEKLDREIQKSLDSSGRMLAIADGYLYGCVGLAILAVIFVLHEVITRYVLK